MALSGLLSGLLKFLNGNPTGAGAASSNLIVTRWPSRYATRNKIWPFCLAAGCNLLGDKSGFCHFLIREVTYLNKARLL